MSRLVVTALSCGLLMPAGPAAAARLELRVPDQRITVGDRVPLVLELRLSPHEAEARPRFPAWGDRWGAAEVVSSTPPSRQATKGGGAVWRQEVRLCAFSVGEVGLPPVEVVVPLERRTLRLTTPEGAGIRIASVLPPEDPAPRPAAPAAPAELPWGEAFWWTLSGGLVLLLASLAVVARRVPLRPAGEASHAPRPDPRAELEQALAALASETDPMAIYDRLSAALRGYLGRLLEFPALESTTREVLRRLIDIHLPPAVVREVRRILTQCDLVRYARQAPERPAATLVDGCRALSGELEQHLAPGPPQLGKDAA